MAQKVLTLSASGTVTEAANAGELGYTPVNKAGDTGIGPLSSAGFSTGKGNVSATTAVTYTMFTLSGLCRWEVFATLSTTGNPTAFTAFATVVFDGVTGRIVANNGSNMVISLSGANVQVTQSAGSTNTIYYSWVCLPA